MNSLIIKTARLMDSEEVKLLNIMLKEYKDKQNNDLLVEIMKLPFVDSVKIEK